MPPAPDAVRCVGLVGTGVIGSGWALHFLRRGFDVAAFDPAPDAAQRLTATVERHWPTMERLGLAPGARRDRLRVAESLEAAVADAQVVQESTPEDRAAKVALFARLDAAAAPDVALLSSTSGFAMSDLQAGCAHPGRTVVGHPFNPPYLIPLVEVVGGARTDPAYVDWAAAFYTAAGKHVLRMERELPGFIGNRLQEAMWREALHMVAAGEATVEQIDAAIAHGPGLRWAAMGPCLTFHLAGGAGGMAHMLDHFGPALEEPWTRLAAPPLTDQLRERMVDGCRRAAGGRSIADLERERDACLIAILEALDGIAGRAPGD
ncbi:MAG: 3-hydroxyacyl-CoA dehydrogenase NAD-binding domain-containing protein [Alphaproteobacteria bacterium]